MDSQEVALFKTCFKTHFSSFKTNVRIRFLSVNTAATPIHSIVPLVAVHPALRELHAINCNRRHTIDAMERFFMEQPQNEHLSAMLATRQGRA